MFIRQAALLVCDDLSSALNVETEQRLGGAAFRAAGRHLSGRFSSTASPAARADQIVVLKSGRVEDEGKLEPLLERCPEMRSLWEGRAANEDE